MRIATMWVFGALLAAAPAAAQDQPVQQHNGLWGGFGLGWGQNLTDVTGDGSMSGFAGYGRIGGTLNQRVLLAGESSGWFGSQNDVDFTRGNLSFIVMFYPSPRGGLYLKGGVGAGYIMTSISSGTTIGGVFYSTSISESKAGFGATAGLGYDIRLGKNIYLVPALDWYLQAVGSDSGELGDFPGTNNIIALTLGLTWH